MLGDNYQRPAHLNWKGEGTPLSQEVYGRNESR